MSRIVARRVLSMACALLLGTSASARIVPVSDEPGLLAAIGAAEAGDEIVLAPGDYFLTTSGVNVSRPGTAAEPIRVRAAVPGCTRIVFDTPGAWTEGFRVAAPWWIFEDLVVEGDCADDTQCEHAFHVVGEADYFVLRRCVLRNFNAQVKGNGEDVGLGRAWPDDVLIENNELFNDAVRDTGNPVTPLDIVGGRRWIVRGNFIHDAGKRGADGVSYQAFLKGNSRDGVFEGNVVACSWLHGPEPGQARVGLSFGGGGSGPDPICEDGDCSVEHQGGLMRNNVILRCNDVGIYLNEAMDCRVHHNTLYANAGIDVRFPPSTVDLRNNLLAGRIRARDGGTFTGGSNVEMVGDATFEAWFVDPAARHFALAGDGSAFVDRGETLADVMDDYCGAPRGAIPDVGALEYEGGACDTRLVPPLLLIPDGTPPMGPGASLRVRKAPAAGDLLLAWAAAGDGWWNVYRGEQPDVLALFRPLLTSARTDDEGALGEGVSRFYVARAVEPCSGVEAD